MGGEPLTHRRLTLADAAVAADLHRRAGAHIPGYDTSLHTPAQFEVLYRKQVLVEQEVWGGFERERLVGFVALKRGWIDHLYVEPDRFGHGIGGGLVRLAQREQAELRLYTSNRTHAPARSMRRAASSLRRRPMAPATRSGCRT